MSKAAVFVLLAAVLAALVVAMFLALPRGPETLLALAALVTPIAALASSLLGARGNGRERE